MAVVWLLSVVGNFLQVNVVICLAWGGPGPLETVVTGQTVINRCELPKNNSKKNKLYNYDFQIEWLIEQHSLEVIVLVIGDFTLECITGTIRFVLLVIEFEFSEHDAFCKLWDIDDILGPKTLWKIKN